MPDLAAPEAEENERYTADQTIEDGRGAGFEDKRRRDERRAEKDVEIVYRAGHLGGGDRHCRQDQESDHMIAVGHAPRRT